MRYVIIGNGTAGVEAALAIRKRDEAAEITMLTADPHSYYYRPKLVEYIGEDMPVEKLSIYKEDFFAAKNIAQKLGVTVTAIDRSAKKVIAADGEYVYDRLLLATGAKANVPPMDTDSPELIHVLRDIRDADRIRACACDSPALAVSGGGLLGLEIAYALIRTGRKVCVIEAMPYLLPRQIDAPGAAFLEKKLREKGFEFSYADTVRSFTPGEVTLESGRKIAANALVVSAGIRSDVQLAQQAGLACGRGILINDTMRTSDPDIFAAGDACEHEGRVYGLWTVAREQGRIAGEIMSGADVSYTGSVPAANLKITGIDLMSAGDFANDAADVSRHEKSDYYIRVNRADGAVIGGIVIGNSAAVKDFRGLMAAQMSYEEFRAKYL